MSFRTYSELSRLETFAERFEYLRLNGQVGKETFGYDRYLNQVLYKSDKWKQTRNKIIIRDNGFDMGVVGFPIKDSIYIHHMNPITLKDIDERNPDIFNPEYLICVSLNTHNAIHYGDDSIVKSKTVIVRHKNDTCPWRH